MAMPTANTAITTNYPIPQNRQGAIKAACLFAFQIAHKL